MLISSSILLSQLASLGTPRILIKFFPLFRTSDKTHRGFLLLGLIIPMIGFLFFGGGYAILKDFIISRMEESSELFVNYYYYVLPLTFFMIINLVLGSFLRMLYHSVIASMLRQVILRLTHFIQLLLLMFDWISIDTFFVLFALSYAVNVFIASAYLIYLGELKFKPDKAYFTPRIYRLIGSYGAFTIFTGFSGQLVGHIDQIMVGSYQSFTNAGVYSIAVYISTIVLTPSNAIAAIAVPLLSRLWKAKKLDEIAAIQKKTSITMAIIGGLFLVGIWVNVDNILTLLPKEYSTGKWPILILCLGKVFSMITSTSGPIITISKYYRFELVAAGILIAVTIVTNALFIPPFGMVGAALATMVSLSVFSLVRTFFVYKKLHMQPFSMKTLLAGLLLISIAFFVGLIPKMDSTIVDVLIRSTIVVALVLPTAYFLKLSPDINGTIELGIKKGSRMLGLRK